MENEKIQPEGLSGEETKFGILAKLSDSLDRSGHLHPANNFSKVRAIVDVRLELDDRGTTTKDNHHVEVTLDSGLPKESETRVENVHLEVEPVPPNQFRVETGQDVPVKTIIDGKTVTKKVRYAARKVEK